MDGNEIKTERHEDGSWEARDGELVGVGASEDEAQRDLLRIKTETPNSPKVSELTKANKAEVTSTFAGEVSRLIVTKLKNPQKIDGKTMPFVAYYNDEPELQGYGENETAARLNLFSKKKSG